MSAPKPFARPKSELAYRPVETKSARNKQMAGAERRQSRKAAVRPKSESRFDGFGEIDPTIVDLDPAGTTEAPKKSAPVKKPFELQPHLTHRPFAGLKSELKGSK